MKNIDKDVKSNPLIKKYGKKSATKHIDVEDVEMADASMEKPSLSLQTFEKGSFHYQFEVADNR